MPYDPPPELAGLSLSQIADAVAQRKLPPVEQWSPEREGDSEMRIAADGTWFHQGGRISRVGMVRAFAGLLLRDGAGQHWLVTPFERLRIEVEDAGFIATDLKVDSADNGETALTFRLNTDDLVIAGPDHPIRVAGDPQVPAIYVMVRHGVEARLNRSTYQQVIEHALKRGHDPLAVSSSGATFPLVPSA